MKCLRMESPVYSTFIDLDSTPELIALKFHDFSMETLLNASEVLSAEYVLKRVKFFQNEIKKIPGLKNR